MNTKNISWMFGLILGATIACWGQSASDALHEEGVYRSPMEGFAIKPPLGGQKATDRIPGVLAQWTKQDPKTGESLWTLRVYRSTFLNKKANIREYAQAVTDSLADRPHMKMDNLTYMDVAGCPAIEITAGTEAQTVTDATGIESKLPPTQLRQAWFLRGPGEFIVVDLTSLGKRSEWIDSAWENLLSTIELFDAKEFLLEQEKQIKQAGEFLGHLTGEAIQNALPKKPRWYLLSKDNKPIGWLCMEGRVTRREKMAGYEICSWMMLQLKDQPVRLIRQMQFVDANLAMGVWNSRIQIGSGEQSALFVEDGLRQGGVIISTLSDGQRQSAVEKRIPKAVAGMYLPKAVGTILPALLDKSKSAGYTFAEYDRQKNDFQMRTVTVVQPEGVEVRGKYIQAIKITDQPTADAQPLTLWVDAKGQVVKSQSPDGLVSVSAPQADVLKAYPNARGVIAQLNQAQAGKIEKKKP